MEPNMKLEKLPMHCVACRQSVPETVERLNYFAQVGTRPQADDVEDFLQESQEIVQHIESLFRLLCGTHKSALDDGFLYNCLSLGWALATEARNRLEVAGDALERHQQRYEGAENSQHA